MSPPPPCPSPATTPTPHRSPHPRLLLKKFSGSERQHKHMSKSSSGSRLSSRGRTAASRSGKKGRAKRLDTTDQGRSSLLTGARQMVRSPTNKQQYYEKTKSKNQWSRQMELLASQPTILAGLRAGLTGLNNPGGIHKLFEFDEREDGNYGVLAAADPAEPLGESVGPSPSSPQTVPDHSLALSADHAGPQGTGRWLKLYEERVGRMYEKHRCRVSASPHADDSPSVEDMALYVRAKERRASEEVRTLRRRASEASAEPQEPHFAQQQLADSPSCLTKPTLFFLLASERGAQEAALRATALC